MTAMGKKDFVSGGDEGPRYSREKKQVKVAGAPRFEEKFEEDQFRWRVDDVGEVFDDDDDASPLKKFENFDKKESERQN